jgi:transposase
MNSKLHAVTDALDRPLRMVLTASQHSDYIGARAALNEMPQSSKVTHIPHSLPRSVFIFCLTL